MKKQKELSFQAIQDGWVDDANALILKNQIVIMESLEEIKDKLPRKRTFECGP